MTSFPAAEPGAPDTTGSRGWSHDEAKQHTLVERLLERCAHFAGSTCAQRHLSEDDWCERCLAAQALQARTGADTPGDWPGHPANLPESAKVSCLAGGCEWGTPDDARCCLATTSGQDLRHERPS